MKYFSFFSIACLFLFSGLIFSSCELFNNENEYSFERLTWNSSAIGNPSDVRPVYQSRAYKDITPVSDGWIAVGSIYGINDNDGIIVKYDSQGKRIWEKAFGGSNLDEFYSIIKISDGYIINAGCASNDGNLKGLKKNTNGMITTVIVKYDFNGTLLWAKELPVSAMIANDSGFMGVIGRKGDNKSNMEIVQFDNNGTTLWRKPIGNDLNFKNIFIKMHWTWNRCFFVSKILNGPDGYYLFGGTSAEAGSMAPALESGPDVIVSVNTNGKVLSQYELQHSIEYNNIISVNDGIVFAARDRIIRKFDFEMNQTWEVSYEYGLFQFLAEINGNIYITGFEIKSGGNTAYIFGINLNGEIFWDTGLQQVDGKFCTYFPVIFKTDNGFIVYQYAYNYGAGEIAVNSFRFYSAH